MPKPKDPEKLVDAVHEAVRAFVEGNGGRLSVVGPIEIVEHKALVFDVVVRCVGQPPKRRAEDKT